MFGSLLHTPDVCVVELRLVGTGGGVPSTVIVTNSLLSTQLSERASTVKVLTPSLAHLVTHVAERVSFGAMSPSSTSRPNCELPIRFVPAPSSSVVVDDCSQSPELVESRNTADAMYSGL